MNYLSIKEIIHACNGNLVSTCKNIDCVNYIVIDSRQSNEYSAFIAIVGENFDGHDFINSAIKNGCKVIIKNKNNKVKIDSMNISIIEVENTTLALGDIARFYRNKFNINCIGITGSVGKTSTRDIIYAVVSNNFNTLKNSKNLNNQFGVPLTLMQLNNHHECAIIEMGMSGFNEIKYLVDIANPEIGVITNIGLSHIEMLGSREGIFKAKMEITNNFNKNSFLIVNGDDDMLCTLKNQHLNYNLKTYGFKNDNDIYCINFDMKETDTTFNLIIDGNIEEFYIPTIGEHNIYNAMAAILVGKVLGMSLDQIRSGLNNIQITKSRMDIIKCQAYTIIDSVYNASVDSMNAALKILGRYNNHRKVAILSNMLEMGDYSEFAHREVGKIAKDYADILVSIGKDARFINEQALKEGFNQNNAYYFETNQDAINNLDNILLKGDVILVKASRGMHLEEIVNFLKTQY